MTRWRGWPGLGERGSRFDDS